MALRCLSRQTISNWENGKTYPDIVSVVKMSSLYNISLDHLLKGEEPMSDYLEYLGESTDIVKSKNKLSKLILIVAYLGIWAISLIVFWFFIGPADGLGYSVMFTIILLPVTTFVISLLIGKNNYWGKAKWISVIVFGVMHMLAEYATFNAANMVAHNRINTPHFVMVPIGALISIIGLAMGVGINRLKSKTDVKR